MKFKSLIILLLIVTVFFQHINASGASYDDGILTLNATGTSAQAAILYCADTGEIVYGSNVHTELPMASTTKIMTCLVVIDNMPLDNTITVDKAATCVEGSSAYLFAGEKITVRDLLYALMLESANDASVALAIAVAGDVESFADLMNQKAKSLGLENTHYINPHGLDADGHYTSAYDLAILMSNAMQDPIFAEISGTYKYTCKMTSSDTSRVFYNHNKLLNSCQGVCGGKTGYTKKCGRCLVSYAVRDGISMCAVTLNDPNDWRDHSFLYDCGFDMYEKLECTGESFEIPVVNGISTHVKATSSDTTAVVKRDDVHTLEKRVILDRFYYAGIDKGEKLGYVGYYIDGSMIAESDIIAEKDVAAIKYKNIIQKILSFFTGN